MSEFTAIEAGADAGTLEQESVERLEAAFEGWTPAEGNLEVWLVKTFSRIGASLFDQASTMSAAAFRRFGEAIVGVPPILAAPASASSTWTMVDNAGYTIPLGTKIAVEATGDVLIAFATTEEVTVAPGSTTATVPLEAVVAGVEGNGLSGSAELIDALAFVATIALEGVTSGGVDEEEEDAYLNRLVETLRLLSLSLIVAQDFEIDARAVAGIHRAKAIPGYDGEAKTENNPLKVTVFPVDAAGAALSGGVKIELKERQQAKVPSGVLVYASDPAYTELDVKVTVVVEEGFDPTAVAAAVKARLNEYLAPANWGLPKAGDSSNSGGWVNRTTVYRFELVSEVDRVPGVDRVSKLELAKHGSALGTADVALTGPVSLTKPITMTVETA